MLDKLRRILGYAFNWVFNPITNDAGTAVSLGRLLLLIVTLKIVSTGNLYALMVVFLVLVMYCWGNKPELREVVMCFATRLNPNALLAAPAPAAKVALPVTDVDAQIQERTEYPPEEKPPPVRKEADSAPLI